MGVTLESFNFLSLFSVNDLGHNGIFKFDTEEKDWELITKCPVPLHDVRIISTSTALYIIGKNIFYCSINSTRI